MPAPSLAEPAAILAAVRAALTAGPLTGRHVLVTSGPTQEPIDPVRYIANRSSGAQGTAIAAALRDAPRPPLLVTTPVHLRSLVESGIALPPVAAITGRAAFLLPAGRIRPESRLPPVTTKRGGMRESSLWIATTASGTHAAEGYY